MMTTDQVRAQSKTDEEEDNLQRLVDYFGEAMEKAYPKKTDRLVETVTDDDEDEEYDDDEDELMQALVFLNAAFETLRGVSWLDGKKDFLTKRAAFDMESLMARMKEFLNQYEVEDHSEMFYSITGED